MGLLAMSPLTQLQKRKTYQETMLGLGDGHNVGEISAKFRTMPSGMLLFNVRYDVREYIQPSFESTLTNSALQCKLVDVPRRHRCCVVRTFVIKPRNRICL